MSVSIWAFVWAHLPELLHGIGWNAGEECFFGDIDGRPYRVYEWEPFCFFFATGERLDMLDYIAQRRGKTRDEIMRILVRARDRMDPAPVSLGGGNPWSAHADAVAFADGNVRHGRAGG